MSYPLSFFYKLSGDEYTHKPQGVLNVNRLLQHQAPWRKLNSSNMAKKSLILGDWTAAHWTPEQIEENKKILAQLMDDGFELYVWQHGQVKQFRKEDLAKLDRSDFRMDITPEQPNTIIHEAMAQHHQLKAKDQMLVLDDYWLKTLKTQKEPKEEYSLSDIALTPHDKTKVLNLIKQRKPRITKILLDEFSLLTYRKISNFLPFIRKEFPFLPLIKSYRTLNLNGTQIQDLLTNETKSLSLLDLTLTSDDLLTVETMVLNNNETSKPDLSFENISLVLSQTPSLRQLQVQNAVWSDTTTLSSLKALEKIHLYNSASTLTNLHGLLNAASNLKTLKLNLCTVIDGDDFAGKLDFPHLEEFELIEEQKTTSLGFIGRLMQAKNPKKTGNSLSNDHIALLLKATHQLKKLKFNNPQITISKGIDALSPSSRESLEDVSIVSSEINLDDLKHLDLAPNLKKLTLNTVTLMNDSSEKFQLKNLEELHLIACDITSDNLKCILANSPNLRILEIHGCKKLIPSYESDLRFHNLDYLSLHNIEATSKDLFSLLRTMNGVKKLSVKKYLGLDDQNSNDSINDNISFSLSELETLEIVESDITITQLDHVLTNAKQLKSLHLASCNYILWEKRKELNADLSRLEEFSVKVSSSGYPYPLLIKATGLKTLTLKCSGQIPKEYLTQLNFPELENFSIVQASNDKELRHFLGKANKLRSLVITDSEIVGSFISDVNLNSLELLNISNCQFTGNNLQKILRQTPHLKYLNIANNPNLDINTVENLACQSLEELNAKGTRITPKLLSAILKSATNLKALHLDGAVEPPVEILTQQATSLETLSISANAQELKSILRALPHLKTLILVDYLELILDEELEELMQKVDVYPSISALKSEIEYHKNNKPTHAKIQSTDDTIQHDAEDEKSLSNLRTESLQSQPEDNIFLDANTAVNPDKVLKATRLFYPLNPQEIETFSVYNYRLKTYNHLEINKNQCPQNEAFMLSQDGDLDLINVPVQQANLFEVKNTLQVDTDRFYWGTCKLRLTNKWQALPSLSCNEILTHYQTDPPCDDLEIQYSKRDNLYYVCKTSPGEKSLSMDFIIELKTPNNSVKIPNDIQEKITFYSSEFGEGELDTKSKEHPTGQDYLDFINKQKRGVCRHRAVAFQAWMNEQYPKIPVRYISNKVHAFAEIQIDGQWIPCNLGGFPSHLQIDDSLRPDFLHPDHAPKTDLLEPLNLKTRQFIQQGLETWNKKEQPITDPQEYCQHLIQNQSNNIKKVLVEVSQHDDVQALQLELQHYCKTTSRPFFYVNSPDDLVCSAAWIKINAKGVGTFKKGPGGPLHAFLSAPENESPIIIVNYDKFDADDIVRFNGLLDEQRHADGTPLPAKAMVIGIMDINKPDCYQGEDFYSRFDAVEINPLTSAKLKEHQDKIAPLPFSTPDNDNDVHVIDLFHAQDWEERLLGRWTIQGKNLIFEQGELELALKSDKTIVLKNAPMDNERFHHLWRQAVLRESISCPTGPIEIASTLKLLTDEGYSWPDLNAPILNVDDQLIEQADALNPSLLTDFITRYACNDEDHTLITLPGIIESKKDSILHVNLTRSLSVDEWALFLSTCAKHHVNLYIHAAQPELLPVEILETHPCVHVEKAQTMRSHTQQIMTKDADLTLLLLEEGNPDRMVIDVSECSHDDLLIKTNAELNRKTGQFSFQQTRQALLLAMEQKKTVVLKGRFSQELKDYLAPLLIQRQHEEPAQGQLILISEEKRPPFPFLPIAREENITLEMKRHALAKNNDESDISTLGDALLEREPLSRLQARLNHQKSVPGQDPWQGVYDLQHHFSSEEVNEKTSKDIADAFTQDRLKKVKAVLEHSPCVSITGITGTGKSTFVTKHFSDKLYISEANIEAWALDHTPDKLKTLFIDEANLSSREWSDLEGLFHHPKGILIKGQFYPLSDEHKVIFAFNPQRYGDERTVAPFFVRHGGAVVFDPLPPAFIYEKILKPVFDNTEIEAEALKTLCDPILKVYGFLTQHSKKEVLISPRELQMMALFVWSAYQKSNNFKEAQAAAHHYAYELALHLTPEAFREALDNEFKHKAKWDNRPLPLEKAQAASNFVVTPSREPLLHLLDDLLQLRDLRTKDTAKKVQKYGGLGGIIIEGEPGLGKSELVRTTLLSHGYAKITADNKPDKGYYHIPVSMQAKEKDDLLRRAFDEGAGVLIDEINSSPMMERLLNALLMGKTPEGKKPNKPGFFVIGTQNPSTMAGRRAASTALKRRLITTTLPLYTRKEMLDILKAKGLNHDTASYMVDTYEKKRQEAQAKNLSPLPTFRDLERLSSILIEAGKSKMEMELTKIMKDFFINADDVLTNTVDSQMEIDVPDQEIIREEEKYIPNEMLVQRFRNYVVQRRSEAKTFTSNMNDLAGLYNGIAFFSRILNKFDAKEKIETAEKIIRILSTNQQETFEEREIGALNNKRLKGLMDELSEEEIAQLGLEDTDRGFIKKG